MMKKLSFKAKKILILAGIITILVSILTGFSAIGAAKGIENLAKTTVGEPNSGAIWAIIMLWMAGLMDIFIGFGGVILGGFLAIGKLEKGSED